MSAEDTARFVEAYSKASAAGLDIRQEGRGETARYRLQKRNNIFRFCFAYPGGTPSDWVGRPESAMFCGHFNRAMRAAQARGGADGQASEGGSECVPRRAAARTSTASGEEGDDYDMRNQGVSEGGVSEFRGIRLAPEFLRKIDRIQRTALEAQPGIPEELLFPTREFGSGLVSFKVYTRSTEGILYYLGEVTRRRLFTEFGGTSRTTQVKTGLRYGTFPLSDCDDRENGASWESKSDLVHLSRRRAGTRPAGSYYCENLFVLEADGASPDQVIGVTYDGKHFGIPRDANKSGRTLQVLELVKQLLALNTSAKQLPTTSVISVIGQ
jgi:hypothetical protein